MNVMPAVSFYMRRHKQLTSISKNSPEMILDLAKILVPFIKKYWPQLNDRGLLDDVLHTLDAVFSSDPDAVNTAYPDPTQS